jgi:hypothetical protein
MHTEVTKRGGVFARRIRSLLSDPTDEKSFERAVNSFSAVVHQATKMVFVARTKVISFDFHFPCFGDLFSAASMKEASADTLSLTSDETSMKNPVWYELQRALVRQTVLPRCRVNFKDHRNRSQSYEVYKPHVLASFSGY